MLANVFHLLDRDGDGAISGNGVANFFSDGNAAATRTVLGVADAVDARTVDAIAKGIDAFGGLMDLGTFMRLHAK